MSEMNSIFAKRSEANKNNSDSRMRRTDHPRSVNPSVDRILFLQRTVGNQAVQRLLRLEIQQAKLRIGKPGDVYEQEADRVADEVMRMPEPEMQRQVEPEEEDHKLDIQVKASHQTAKSELQVDEDLESNTSQQTWGDPISKEALTFFEPHMKHDFSRVRVHKDNEAVQMNRQLDARAFTHGMDIYFGGGQFDPGSLEGKRLLAHELTHLVQQSASQGGKLHIIQRFEAGPPTEPDLEDLGEAGNEFDENHQDLTERERLKIHSALRNILQRYDPHYRRYERNLHLWIDYLNYYSSHPLEKATDDDIVDWGENELARTRGSVTTLRPSVFGLSNITLGGVLIHEFTHTRHRTIVGMQHQEGEAYGIEFFFAERTNNLERMARILPFYQDPSSVGVTPNSINAFRRLFHIYYATMVCLYDVIDNVRSSYDVVIWPLRGLTREEAYRMTSELVQNREGSRSDTLRSIYHVVSVNLERFPIRLSSE